MLGFLTAALAFAGPGLGAARRRRAPPRLAAPTTEALSSQLLDLIADTDLGVAAPPQRREEIAEVIESLEAAWKGTDAFSAAQRPLLLRECEVVYVGQNSSVRANAAGGKYRGRLGRLLFRTDALFQHVLAPPDDGGDGYSAVNVISFRLFGCIPGSVVLPGRWERAAAQELDALRGKSPRALSSNTVRVGFDPPRVSFGREGGVLSLRLGPSSTVALDCTYLDERLRVARGGSSGTIFVFRADTCAEGGPLYAEARQWRKCLARPPCSQPQFASALLTAAVLAATVGRGAARLVALPLLAGAVGAFRSTGGIVVDGPRALAKENARD